MEKGIRRDFDEVLRIYQGGSVPKDENISHFKNNFKSFIQYCQKLSDNQECDNLTNIIMRNIKEVLEHLVNTQEVCQDNFKQYYMMLRQQESGYKYTGKEQSKIEGEYKTSLYELIMRVKIMLDQSDVIETSLLRERNSLIELGIDRMLPVKSEKDKIKALIDEQFSVSAFVNRNVIESLALNIFWINKLTKYVQTNQAGFILAMDQGKEVSIETIDQITEEEKYIALRKLSILTKTYQLFMDTDRREMADIDFADFLSKVFFEKIGMTEEKLLEEGKDDEANTKKFLLAIRRGKKVPKDMVEAFQEIEKEYNELFSQEEVEPRIGQFLSDCRINHNFCAQIKQLYEIKDALIMELLGLLQLDHKRVIPNYKNWGIHLDSKNSEDSKAKNILFLDLPGYLKPLTVHVLDHVMDKFFKEDKFPLYRGAFLRTSQNKDEKYMTTNMLFKVSPEQFMVVKNAYATRRKKKMKLSPREKLELDVIQHMYAVASNNFSKIPMGGEENPIR